jgi:hypothetical protein
MYVELRRTSADTADLCELRDVISAGRPGAPLHVSDGLIVYADGVSVPNSSAFVPKVLKRAHTATHEGARVRLRLFHRLAQSLVAGSRGVVRHTYAGQDTVLERMGTVFNYLQPTVSAYLYNVFPRGCSKPVARLTADGSPQPEPHAGPMMVGLSTAVATWVPVDAFHVAHPSLQLEDELIVEGGRSVMVGKRVRG